MSLSTKRFLCYIPNQTLYPKYSFSPPLNKIYTECLYNTLILWSVVFHDSQNLDSATDNCHYQHCYFLSP